MGQMDWEIIEREPASAEENMEWDARLLRELGGRTRPILHLYAWERPSVTFGHFIQPEKILNLQAAKRRGIDWARRPTGGGVVFHLWDLAFSVLVPAKSKLYSANTLENYQLINRVVQEIAKEWVGEGINLTIDDADFHVKECTYFCMARPTKYDVVVGGKKIAGAAQRKTREGFLHQGTIALARPQEEVLEAVVREPEVRIAMVQKTYPLDGKGNLTESRKRLSQLLKQHFVKL